MMTMMMMMTSLQTMSCINSKYRKEIQRIIVTNQKYGFQEKSYLGLITGLPNQIGGDARYSVDSEICWIKAGKRKSSYGIRRTNYEQQFWQSIMAFFL